MSGPVEIFEADLQKKGLADFFSATVWSSGVGYRKPDPAIFNIALDTLGVEASNRVLMVGDSEVADILGGNAVGLTTVKVTQSTESSESVASSVVTGPDLLEFFRSRLQD